MSQHVKMLLQLGVCLMVSKKDASHGSCWLCEAELVLYVLDVAAQYARGEMGSG